MKQIVNSRYKELFINDSRYYILMGGRSAGRSFVASQFALAKLISHKYFRCAIMRFVLTDVRNSIYQEIVDRVEETEEKTVDIKDLEISKGNNFIKGIGFRKSSGDQKSKLKSIANYNCVIIEEADEVSEEDFIQLDDSLRTLKSDIKIILLFNPPNKNHWLIKRWFNLITSEVEGFYIPELKKDIKDTTFIHTTYKDNIQNINESTIDNFASYKEKRPDHYYNMVEGLVSEGARGRIFKDWKIISDEDYEALPFPTIYGMDFGYTCLVGDTLVQTNVGNKRLDNIQIGDKVLTRKGYKTVSNTIDRGFKDVYRIDFGYGYSIIATADHKIFTSDGWKMVSKLSNNENICIQKKSFTIIKNTKDIMENIPTITSLRVEKKLDFIEIYTNAIMERFQKGLIYTMLTLIVLITLLKTLWLYLGQTIKKLTTMLTKVEYKNYLKKKWRNIEQSTDTQKKTGKIEEKLVWLQLIQKSKTVLNVRKVLHQLTHIKNTVVQYVEKKLIQEIARNSLLVRIAQRLSKHQLIIQEYVAQKNVPIYLEHLTEQRKVFDISVEDEREFFANGILVHNCDPTAVGELKLHNNEVYVRELIHESGLVNKRISERLEDLGISKSDPIYADSAEPKSIEELRIEGWNVIGAVKGADSINVGIDMMLSRNIHYTQSSKNIDREQQNYKWALDRNKEPTNKPLSDGNDHQIDQIRYAIYTHHIKTINQANIRLL